MRLGRKPLNQSQSSIVAPTNAPKEPITAAFKAISPTKLNPDVPTT
jgi:hypothetical protein